MDNIWTTYGRQLDGNGSFCCVVLVVVNSMYDTLAVSAGCVTVILKERCVFALQLAQ
jgi:hypothetical protein